MSNHYAVHLKLWLENKLIKKKKFPLLVPQGNYHYGNWHDTTKMTYGLFLFHKIYTTDLTSKAKSNQWYMFYETSTLRCQLLFLCFFALIKGIERKRQCLHLSLPYIWRDSAWQKTKLLELNNWLDHLDPSKSYRGVCTIPNYEIRNWS